ncbi:MAG: DUF5110 domain-containing protein [Bacteroidaceae bacterium]|nr:DUF5110 domain-containing protein [Bacteroidaceae bacterium]
MAGKSIFVSLMVASVMIGCSARYERTEQGVVVKVAMADTCATAPRYVRLQVLGDKIVRVSATAEKAFADKQSLIVVDGGARTSDYNVEEHGDTIVVSTRDIRANVLCSTGEVWFTDSVGRLIVKEQEGGGKTFHPYECVQTHADGKDERYKGWTVRQVFENLDDDEALYGLGQHQADEWNYKGRNEELFQYNTKVSIPFVVSSNNYGILLDSYSLCRFGNPNDYSQLHRVFRLKDKEGKDGALTGTYTAPRQQTLVRREDSIYFENLKSAKNLPRGFRLDNASVVYEGTIIPNKTGQYRFSHYYSGYQKVFIGGRSVYTEDVMGKGSEEQEIWRTAWNPNARKFAVDLEAGKEYPIRIEWRPDGGEAYCGLRVLEPVDEAEQRKMSWWSEMTQQLDYYFIAGDNADEVISGYRTLTGKAPIMPEWLLGYWQSRERYKTQDEILGALDGFRRRHLPIDNIVMDWNYWVDDQWGAFKFDPARFADPKAMIDSIHGQNARIMISCWPKYYFATDNYRELRDKGYIYQQSVRDSLQDWLGFKYAFYDAYAPEARRIYWRQLYENLGTIGMDAWWMDASEPNVRDCTDMAYRKLLCGPTALGSSDEYFNAYSIVNAEAIYDGQRGYETAVERKGIDPMDGKALDAAAKWDERGFGNDFSPNNRRVFLLTRNGFAAEQRYSTATWSGDIGTRWEDLKAQITAGLNFSISGVPFWSQDIGGFSVERRYQMAQAKWDATGVEDADLKDWRELNVRWHQLGMFAPMYRSHGQFPFREPWNIAPEGHPAYDAIRACMEMRYRLMPYIYSLTAAVHFSDYTMMRPLVMDFGSDKRALGVGYQFMFGPSLMVCPVYQYGARARKVYFPKDNVWYDLFSGKVVSEGGEEKFVGAPYEHIPLFVRAGSIIPLGPQIEYTRQKPADNIRLYIYKGADGEFSLYEDEGVNYGYEAGRYATIRFTYDDEAGTLCIHDREGEYPGMLRERKFTIVPVGRGKAQPYDPDASGIEVKYTGKKVTVKI